MVQLAAESVKLMAIIIWFLFMKEQRYIRNEEGKITYEEGGKTFQVPDTAKVSMNFWCFDPAVFPFIEKIFMNFF